MANAIKRRLFKSGSVTVPALPPAPIPVATAAQGPTFRAPTTVQPAADVQPRPAFDIGASLRTPAAAEPSATDAIGRALLAFGRGAAATPSGAGHDAVLGGIVGGLSGAGQAFQDRAAERSKELEPARAVRKMIVEESVKRQVSDPYDQAKESREQAGREKLMRERHRLAQESADRNADKKARDANVSVSDYLKLRSEASNDLAVNGVLPGDETYEALIDATVRDKAGKAKQLGVGGIRVPPAPAPQRTSTLAPASGSLPGLQ